jgi:O-antigen/teichoic acid export membrane protein
MKTARLLHGGRAFSFGARHGDMCALPVALQITQGELTMRALEIIAALIVAGVLFIVFKLIGLAIHIAIVGAVIGLVVGFIVARMFRRD